MYKVSFYTVKGDISPISDFLDSCSESLRAKILRQLKYVQEYGLTPAVPNLRKITNTSLWELRVLGRDNVRMFCINLPGKKIKVLHIFKKKKQKTPIKEIKIAVNRYSQLTNDI